MLVTRGRDDEFVKVLDFGIAKVRGVALTHSGMVFGTPEYMSPEQLRGRDVDGRSDLYALGVLLFEMLTGRLPFAAETPEQLMTAHLELQPPSVREVVGEEAEVPRELEALVARLLAKDAAQRPGTAEELGELLGAAGMAGGEAATAVGGKKSDPAGRGSRGNGGREARVRAALVGAIVGAVAVAAMVVVVAGGRRGASTATSPTPPTAATTSTPTTTPPRSTPTSSSKESSNEVEKVGGQTSRKSVEELQREFLSMKSGLSVRDRKAAWRAVEERIDGGGGAADARAQKKRDALIELIRQHAK